MSPLGIRPIRARMEIHMNLFNRAFIVTTVLLTAGIAGSLALGAATDHAKTTETKSHASPSTTPFKPATPKKELPPSEPTPSRATPAAQSESSKADAVPSTPDQALAALEAGNARWVSGNTTNPNTSAERRADTAANGQKPFVTIYTCADSRLPVERIFDCGVGDVFVLRIAGNVIGDHSAGTIEYGVDHLHTPLLVVMGHTKCGAVGAACSGGHAGGNIDSLLSEITPAVDRAKKAHPDAENAQLVDFAVRENVWQSIFDLLRTSESVRTLVSQGKVRIVGAVCDISTGKVDFLGEHPWQSQLLQALAPTAQPAPAVATTPAEPAHEASAGDEDEHH